MNLLNIWHTGGITEALLGFAVIVSGILWYQVYKASKSGSIKQYEGGSAVNVPFYKLAKFWMGVAVWVIIILAIAFIVAPDYRGA